MFNINKTNIFYIIILFMIINSFSLRSCCKINYNSFPSLFDNLPMELNVGIGITENNWMDMINNSN